MPPGVCHRSRRQRDLPRFFVSALCTLFGLVTFHDNFVSAFSTCYRPTSRIRRTSPQFNWKKEKDGWEVGDVYRDLDVLENAIMLATADQRLQQEERMEMLDHLAKAKRPVLPDVQKFVFAPLLTALLLRMLAPIALRSGWGNSPMLLLRNFTRLLNLQFWTMVVVAPIPLLLAKRMTKPPPEPMREELQGLSEKYLDLVDSVEYDPPETSCQDHVLFLLEYWTSAVATMAALGLRQAASANPVPGLHLYNRIVGVLGGAMAQWMMPAQILTRIGAVAALYQNPKQVFQLHRSKQPRPMTFFPTILQPLVSAMLWILPLGLASDVFQLLMGMSFDAVVALYSTLATIGLGTWARMEEVKIRETKDGLEVARLKGLGRGKRWLYTFVALASWRRPMSLWMQRRGLSNENVWRWFHMPISELPPGSITRLISQVAGWTSTGAVALTLPLAYIRSLAKIVRVVYTHDISLALDSDDFRKIRYDDAHLKSRMKWRYRLEWREDKDTKRLGKAYRDWKSGIYYWLFREGKAAEKLSLEMLSELEKLQGQEMLLQNRINADIKATESMIAESIGAINETMKIRTYIPRDEWKKIAMERIAAKHQYDYNQKSFDDPLGVALHQSLGIGLGFNFQYMKPLKKGEKPSLLRLYARAAKSAVKRAQDLQDAAMKDLKIVDPKKRAARKRKFQRSSKKELEYLAARMTELVPPFTDGKEFDDVQQLNLFQQRRYTPASSHEIILDDQGTDPYDLIKDTGFKFKRQSDILASLLNDSSKFNSSRMEDPASMIYDPMDLVQSIENDLLNFGFNGTRFQSPREGEGDTLPDAIVASNNPLNSSGGEHQISTDSSVNASKEADENAEDDDEFVNSYLEQQRNILSGVDADDDDTKIMLA